VTIRKTTLASGISLSYREAGDENATTLVQVHGIGTGHNNYDLLTPHLARTLHVLDIDLPGYGESEEALHERSLQDFAGDVAQFVEALGYERVHVHGTSMGGAVAMVLAGTRPDLVDRLVVSCSFGRFDRAAHVMFGTWRLAAQLGGVEALAVITSQQGFSRGFWDRPESAGTQEAFVAALSGTTAEDFLRDLAAIEGCDITAEVRRIRAPTLLLGADEDTMTPLKTGPSGIGMEALHELISSSTLEVLPGCGHFISIERAEATAHAISAFVLSE
jgi:pimeloyl-ACP methyl ester carboxylesterase